MSTDQSNPYVIRALLCIAVCCGLFIAVIWYSSIVYRNKVIEAASHGTVEDIKYFIEHGASVNEKSFVGLSLLHYAALFNHDIDVLKYLVEQGANVNAKTKYDQTLLHIVASSPDSNIEVLKYLIEQGVDVNAKDNRGRTPLDCVTNKEMETILREAGGKLGEELPE